MLEYLQIGDNLENVYNDIKTIHNNAIHSNIFSETELYKIKRFAIKTACEKNNQKIIKYKE